MTHEPPTPTSPLFRLVLLGVLTLALVGSLVWLGVAAVQRSDDGAGSRQSDRDAAMLRAREFLQVYGTYGKADLDDKKQLTEYVERVTPLLTTSAKPGFEESTVALAQLVAEEGFSRSTTVERTGVSSLDDDSANVIVAGQLSGTQGKQAQQPVYYSMLVELEKVDGKWLVADFREIGGEFQ